MKKEDNKSVFSGIIGFISMFCIAILFIIVSFLCFYVVSNKITDSKGEKPLIRFYTIVSPSMEPNINVYDVVVNFRVKDENDLNVGDIITFRSASINTGKYTVTHRIKEIKIISGKKYYITKGDNNTNQDDGMITFSDIEGKVNYRIPGLGNIQKFLVSKLGWLLIIIIPALGIIFMDLFKLTKVFKIKKQIDEMPYMKDVKRYQEQEENKRVRALVSKADRINKKNKRG